MLGIGTALVGLGVGFVKDLITDHGESLVAAGIEKVTGIDLTKKKVEDLTPEEIAVIKDAEYKLRELDYKKLVLELDTTREFNRNDETNRKMSHETYRVKSDTADKVADQIIKWNLPVIAVLVLVNLLLIHALKDEATLIAIASNIIGVVIGKLLGERQSIINFFFGSSIGSKEKDVHINKLQEKK